MNNLSEETQSIYWVAGVRAKIWTNYLQNMKQKYIWLTVMEHSFELSMYISELLSLLLLVFSSCKKRNCSMKPNLVKAKEMDENCRMLKPRIWLWMISVGKLCSIAKHRQLFLLAFLNSGKRVWRLNVQMITLLKWQSQISTCRRYCFIVCVFYWLILVIFEVKYCLTLVGLLQEENISLSIIVNLS